MLPPESARPASACARVEVLGPGDLEVLGIAHAPAAAHGRRPRSRSPRRSPRRRPARSASRSTPRRNICGVCAAHLPRAVDRGRGAAARRSPLQRVGHRQRQQAADRIVEAGVDQAVRPIRAAPGSARHRAPAPSRRRRAPRSRSASRPLATVAARVAPPQRTTQRAVRRIRAPGARTRVSSGASTTITAASGCTLQRAQACGRPARWPASGTYCLGPRAPARTPTPAHGTSA